MKTTRNLLLSAAMAASAVAALPAAEITVNSGSSTNGYVPFHFYYLDNAKCKTQVIYPADGLRAMAGENIREILFYLDDSGFERDWNASAMILSIGETDAQSFDGSAEFITAGLTEVYNGHMEGAAGGKFLKFTLTEPYAYTGSNLLLQVSLGQVGSTYPRASFLGVTTDVPRALYTTNGGSPTAESFLPQTTFTYGVQAQYEAKISAENITFPTTMLGHSSTATVKVENTGAQPLPVALSCAGNAFSTSYAGTEIPAAGSAEIPVTFAPTSAGEETGTLTIALGQAGTFDIALSGSGMQVPTGFTSTFDTPSKSLPEGWTGLVARETYDYDINDYVLAEITENNDYFKSVTVDNIAGTAVDRDNPFRQYPDRYTIYMVSPSVSGNVMMRLAKATSSESYASSNATVYKAVGGADGQWTIGAAQLDFRFASEPGDGWSLMIGSVEEATRLAIVLSSMEISTFAADASGEAVNEYVASVAPENIDFGQIVVGQSVSKEISVRNIGAKAFTLATSAIEGLPFSASVSSAIVEPSATETVTVTFAPEAVGDFSLPLVIDMGQAGTASVAVTGKSVMAVVGSEFTIDGVTYRVTSASEAEVSGVSSELTECAIPASVTTPEGIELAVTAIGREAFYWGNVTKVVLPEGMRSIGYGAFRSSPLAEINLPSTIVEIGDYAFRTTQLRGIEIPEGVTAIGSSVFASCEQLATVALPRTLESIGTGAFYKSALTSVEIPAGCVRIADEAFESCASLSSINLPEGLTEISSMLFLGCSSLTEIEIPSTVTEIKTRAFEDCGLTSLRLPASVGKIASSAFNGTPIGEITVDAANAGFKVVDGVLYDADGSFLYLYPRAVAAEEYSVADGCRGIIGGAFYGCRVKDVVLPESMAGIDEFAFCMSDLREINLPDNIFLIGQQAFAGTALSEVTLPASVETVSDALFAECADLKSVVVPASVTLIGNRAFYNCAGLTEIIALGATPAEFDSWEGLSAPFLNVDCDNVTVYCPDGAEILSAYKSSEWGDFFKNIKSYSDRPSSGIEGVTAAGAIRVTGGSGVNVELGGSTADITVLSVAGAVLRRVSGATGSVSVSSLPVGICIVTVRTSDGSETTAKVAVN